MRGRRRKTKYNWLPIIGAVGAGSESSTDTVFGLDMPGGTGNYVTGVKALVENAIPDEQSEHSYPLNDIIGNEYVIKRIVGKIIADVEFTNTDVGAVSTITIPPIHVGVGLFVARLDPTDPFAGTPVDLAAANTLYNPVAAHLTREPWIWRRTWTLGYPILNSESVSLSGGLTLTAGNSYPQSNIHYGSVLDGAHCDAKTGRRVRQDEALFIGAGAHWLPLSFNSDASPWAATVFIKPDLRVLGALRRARNRSNF